MSNFVGYKDPIISSDEEAHICSECRWSSGGQYSRTCKSPSGKRSLVDGTGAPSVYRRGVLQHHPQAYGPTLPRIRTKIETQSEAGIKAGSFIARG
jgi:hypothetical protein